VGARSTVLRWLVLFLLILGPSSARADDGETGSEEKPQGLEIIDHGVAAGYVRKPLELRFRRSVGLTWVCRGLLLLSESTLVYAQYDQGTGFGLAPFFTPSLATGIALWSVNQMRRGLREHELTTQRAPWRLAGILTLVSGTVTAWVIYLPNDPAPAYGVLALSQLLGVVLIQTQAWVYRREVRPGMWPFDRLGEPKQARREWVPVLVPTNGGAIVGAALAF
jgi:hypothetical protein